MEGTTLRGNDVPSVLTIYAPGYQIPLLAYITGDGDFPSIDTSALLDWQRAFVDGGHRASASPMTAVRQRPGPVQSWGTTGTRQN